MGKKVKVPEQQCVSVSWKEIIRGMPSFLNHRNGEGGWRNTRVLAWNSILSENILKSEKNKDISQHGKAKRIRHQKSHTKRSS